MDIWVAVDFTGASQQNPCPRSSRQTAHVESSEDVGFERLNRVMLIMNGTRRTRHVVNLVALDQDLFGYLGVNSFGKPGRTRSGSFR